MSIQLPCEREDFVFGEPKCTPQLDNTQRMPPVALPVGEIGIIGYSMRAANIWGKVATNSPVRASHSRTVPSALPEAIRRPSGL